MSSQEPVRDEALVTVNDELRAHIEELTIQNSALLAENLQVNRWLAKLEQNHVNARPKLRYSLWLRGASTKKGNSGTGKVLFLVKSERMHFSVLSMNAHVYLTLKPNWGVALVEANDLRQKRTGIAR